MDQILYNPTKMTVLIVDDHDLIRKSIVKILSKMKFTNFVECAGGGEAIKALATEVFDLVICDLYLGSIDGFTVIQAVRQRETNSDIPILVITGEGNKDEIVRAADQGVDDYILKPFQALEFEKKIQNALNKYYSPTPLLSHVRSAEKFLMEGDFVEAKKSILLALNEDPTSARASHLASIIQLKGGQSQAAIENLKSGIQDHPSFLKNYRTLADAYLAEGKISDAIQIMKSELALNPKQPLRQVQLAKLLGKSGDHIGAIEHYRVALLDSNKLKPALFGMGKAYAESDNLEKAIYYFKRMRRHYPTDSTSLEAIVKFSIAAKQPKVAELALRDEKKDNPHRLDTYFILAKLYGSSGRIDDGIAIMEEAQKISPESIDVIALKAHLFKENGNLDEAQKLYQQVVATRKDAESMIALCEIYAAKGEFSLALQLLHKALKGGKDTAKIFLQIAEVTPQTKQFTKSYFIFQRLLQLGRNDPKIKENLAKATREILSRRNKINTQAAS